MTNALAQQQQLTETFDKLEGALLAPPIAGELGQWVRAVQDAAATLSVDLTAYQRTVLHVQYEEIAKTDPEMSAQVEKLKQGDARLLAQLIEFHEQLDALGKASQHVRKDEVKLADQRKRVEDLGIALIVAIKKQQRTSATWLDEAHFRDRGVAAD